MKLVIIMLFVFVTVVILYYIGKFVFKRDENKDDSTDDFYNTKISKSETIAIMKEIMDTYTETKCEEDFLGPCSDSNIYFFAEADYSHP